MAITKEELPSFDQRRANAPAENELPDALAEVYGPSRLIALAFVIIDQGSDAIDSSLDRLHVALHFPHLAHEVHHLILQLRKEQMD